MKRSNVIHFIDKFESYFWRESNHGSQDMEAAAQWVRRWSLVEPTEPSHNQLLIANKLNL